MTIREGYVIIKIMISARVGKTKIAMIKVIIR